MDIILSIVGIVGVLLLVGAFQLFRSGDKRKALLMTVAALLMLANVTIWILPTKDGASLRTSQQEATQSE